VKKQALLGISTLLLTGLVSAQNCTLPANASGNSKSSENTKTLELRDQIGKSPACATLPGITPKKLSVVWAAFLNGNRTGGQRFDTVPPAGTPTGKVLPSAQGVEFDLRAVQAEGLSMLTLRSGQNVIASFSPLTQAIVQVPTQQLKPEVAYDWVLVTRSATYKGRFELPAADDLKDLKQQLDAVSAAESDPKARLFFQAAVLDEAEFYGARDKLLAQLRELTP